MGYNETMKMNYIKFGNGPRTMLILPGLSVRPVCSLADSIAAAYDVFSKDFTVYLFDRREDVPEDYSLEQMADDTVAKIRELDLKDIYLYGVSQGGMIAQIIALKYPELVKKLALASTCSYVEDGTVNKWAEASGKHDLEGLLKGFVTKVYGDAYYEQYKDAIYAAYGDLTKEEMDYFAILASAVNGFDICLDRFHAMGHHHGVKAALLASAVKIRRIESKGMIHLKPGNAEGHHNVSHRVGLGEQILDLFAGNDVPVGNACGLHFLLCALG